MSERQTTRRGEPEIFETLDFDALDSPEEVLAEVAGITLSQARRALEWMRDQGEQKHDHDVSDSILRIVEMIVPKNPDSINPFVVGLRALALRWLLRAQGEPMSQLGARCGVSRQLINFHVRCIEKITGIHAPGQKAISCRAKFSELTRERWSGLDAAKRRARRNSERYRRELAQAATEAGLSFEQAVEISATSDEDLTTPDE